MAAPPAWKAPAARTGAAARISFVSGFPPCQTCPAIFQTATAQAPLLLPGTSSAQNAVFIKFKSILAPGTIINIQNASGTSICTYKTTKHSYFAFVSTLALVNGTYNVFTDGTVSGEHSNGYYPLGIYTAGTKRGSFTTAGKLTSIEL